MKKLLLVSAFCLVIAFLFVGCSNQNIEEEKTSEFVTFGNPWKDFSSIEEAEDTAGFKLGLPNVISNVYEAKEFRTLNNELIEIVYFDGDFEVCVRKQEVENEDISGDYNEYEVCEEINIEGGNIKIYYNNSNNMMRVNLNFKGSSWSLVAPNGFSCGSYEDFINEIIK